MFPSGKGKEAANTVTMTAGGIIVRDVPGNVLNDLFLMLMTGSQLQILQTQIVTIHAWRVDKWPPP